MTETVNKIADISIDVDFGGVVEAEKTFGDYTIPTQLRLGWFFDSERFESEGEFFRCTLA